MSDFLFDIEPFSSRRKPRTARRGPTQMRPEVRQALARLKRTLDTIPPEEMRQREQRWRLIQNTSSGVGARNA